ncbi:MAG: helix-turn-helix domain-containing protein [Gammaproteobacteria bacterium]|uniref:helix-turn-helix domain-containing protein n=1 Tax=Pseudomaricurvus alcaniphilus TaxID=1166482 RepID=UPI00140C0EFF|nr:helix-turn-helix domain-containing protein [Pseudomaricurvus alcaniphilus]MBR9911920.1 helix-turn-helix domain-containing protein [Gammaproteobacteria bacterium]NHN36029.1 helix-turn-helix domain-containing protein [Pseudomaricurvus alcaniphilus]
MASQLGIRLKALREFYGWSQRELAKRAGIPNSAISVIEQGAVSPSVLSLEKVLKGFPISLPDFFAIDIARQKIVAHTVPGNSVAGHMLSAGLQAEARGRGGDIQLRVFSHSAGDSPLNLLARHTTLLLVTAGEAVFSSLSGSQTLRRGDSLTLYTTTPFRLEPLQGEVQWVQATLE